MVELDGHSHDVAPQRDAARDRWMASEDYHVLRFTNAEVQENIEWVVEAIRVEVERLRKPWPSRLREGRETWLRSSLVAPGWRETDHPDQAKPTPSPSRKREGSKKASRRAVT